MTNNPAENSNAEANQNPFLNSWAKPLLELQNSLLTTNLQGATKKQILNNVFRYSRSLERTLLVEETNVAKRVFDSVSDLEMISRIERISEKPLSPEVLHFLKSRIFELKAPLQNKLPVFQNPLASQFEKGLIGLTQIESNKVSFVFPIQEFIGVTHKNRFSTSRKDFQHCQIGELEFEASMVPVFDLSLLICGRPAPTLATQFWVFGDKKLPLFAVPINSEPEILFYQQHQFSKLNPNLRLSQKRSLLGVVRGNQKTLPVINLNPFTKASR